MAIGTLLALLTKMDTFVEKQGLSPNMKLKNTESYKERINKILASYGMSKTRIKFQVFKIDSKTNVENKKRKYLETCFMIGGSGYDDNKLYDLSTKRGFELVCPVQRYKNTPKNRLEMIQFYEYELGQSIYSWRSKSIEPLIEHIKSVFRIHPLLVRGYNKAAGIVLLSVLLYKILIYYNYKTRHSQRPKAIKHMLCS